MLHAENVEIAWTGPRAAVAKASSQGVQRLSRAPLLLFTTTIPFDEPPVGAGAGTESSW